MTSPRRRAANRRNAYKSTGPVSQEGKRRASLNSTKHGLSTPVDPLFFGAQILEIAALVRDECASDDEATELARRIIDYERNESAQRGYLLDEEAEDPRGWPSQKLRDLAIQEFAEEIDGIQDVLDDLKARGQLGASDLRDAVKFRRQMTQVVRSDVKRQFLKAKREREQSLRYLRRSANQLVKAVKALASRPGE